MATYQILYWADIPTQVKAEDAQDEVSLQLDARFMVKVDEAAMSRGLSGTDEFLEQWKWGEEQERAGSAQEVAKAVKAELEAGLK